MLDKTLAIENVQTGLARLMDNYAPLLQEDTVMRQHLRSLQSALQEAETATPRTKEVDPAIGTHIENAARLARDLAEEEQRIIAESPAVSAKEEQETLQYFALSEALQEMADTYRQGIDAMRMEKM